MFRFTNILFGGTNMCILLLLGVDPLWLMDGINPDREPHVEPTGLWAKED